MLEVQEPAGLLEGPVVDRRDVPDEVSCKPQRQSDERMGQDANRCHALEFVREGRCDDVLQKVNREQVVERDRVQRGHVDGEQQDHREVERGPASRVRRPPALAPEVTRSKDADRKQHVPVQRPRMRIHAATLVVTRPWCSGST